MLLEGEGASRNAVVTIHLNDCEKKYIGASTVEGNRKIAELFERV